MAKTIYGADKDIRIAPENTITLSAVIGGTSGSTIKAGTPLSGDLKARNTAFTASSSSPNCVLLHDVKLEGTQANGTVIIQGAVDMLKMDSSVQSLITSAVETALAGKIYFVKGAK